MAYLHKLLVQGVRSFGAGEKDVGSVQFQKPLTLIVGPNGTGKTTLIECLRYATSGDIPPGNLATFIHDVDVAKVSRVDAMVQLSVERAGDAGRVDATRRMTAHKRGKKLQCKSDEATITRHKPDGSVASLSSKVADTNREMCNLLGVSKAVLTNVVFCHQEQSNWPLGEPKKVKETFDEIFSAERYSKAVDVIRKLRTEKMAELASMHKELTLLRRFRDEKVALQSEQRAKEGSITEMESRLETIKAAIVPVEKELKEVCGRLEASERDRAELKTKQEHSDFLSREVSNLEELLRDAPRLFDKLEEVDRELAAFRDGNKGPDEHIAKVRGQLAAVEQQKRTLQHEREDLNQEIANLRSDQKIQYDKRMQRDVKLRDAITDFKLDKTVGGEIKSQDVFEVLDLMDTEKNTAEAQLKEAKAMRERGKHELHESLAQCRADITSHERQARQSDELAESQRRKIAKLQQELESVAEASENIAKTEAEHKSAAEKVTAAEDELDESETEGQLDKLRTEREALDRKLRQLQETSACAHAYNEKRSALRSVEKQMEGKKAQCDQLAEKHGALLYELLGYVPTGKVCPPVDDARQSCVTAARRCESTAGGMRQSTAQADEAAKFERRSLDAKQADIAQIECDIAEATGSAPDLETALRTTAGELDTARSDLADHQGALALYRKFEAEAKKRQCCPLCETTVRKMADGEKLLEKLHARVSSDMPMRVKNAKQKVGSLEKLHEKLLCLKPDEERLLKLKYEAESVQRSLDTAMQKQRECRGQMEKAEEDLRKARQKCEQIDSVRPELCLLDSARHDYEQLRFDWEDASAQMSLFVAQNSEMNAAWLKEGGVEKLHANLLLCQNERDSTDRQCQQMADSLNRHRNRLSTLRDNRASLHQRLLSQRTSMQRHSATEALLRDARAELERICHSDGEHAGLLSPLKRRRGQLEHELSTNAAKWDKDVDTWTQRAASVASELQTLHDLQASVERYDALGVSSQLDTAESRQSQIDASARDADAQVEQLRHEMDKLTRSASERQLAERRLRDNRTLIERNCQLATVLREIDAANRRLGTMHVGDVDEVINRKRKLTDELNQLNGEMSEIYGELRAVRSHVADVRDKLKSKNFANNDRELIEKIARQLVLNDACTDLQKYARVLDTSIMKFHAGKMQEINNILHDYWKVIYNGNDIDYVQIRSEADEGKVSDKRRNYNYRVVMICNGVEMDMRARCSAGQKVLASILIRIALAEVFCDSCGILTLDEPTTNLDKEKVTALADALSRLVAERRQANDRLQLVVITHDARFVAHMVRACQPDVFYRLQKDENGKTKIDCMDAMVSLEYLE